MGNWPCFHPPGGRHDKADRKQDQDLDAMIDRLLEGERPEEGVGSDGLLEDLTKRVFEGTLKASLPTTWATRSTRRKAATAATRVTAGRGSA